MIENGIPEQIWAKWMNALSWHMAESAYNHALKFKDSPVNFVLNLGCGSDNSYDNCDEIEELPYGPFLARFLSYHSIPSVNIDYAAQGEFDLSLPYASFYEADIFKFDYASILETYPVGFDLIFCDNVMTNPTKYYLKLMPYRVRDSIEFILHNISPIVAESGIVKIDSQIYKMNSGQFELLVRG